MGVGSDIEVRLQAQESRSKDADWDDREAWIEKEIHRKHGEDETYSNYRMETFPLMAEPQEARANPSHRNLEESSMQELQMRSRTARQKRTSNRKGISMSCPVIDLLLCTAIAGMGLGAAMARGKDQAYVSQAPELEAGFHLLYELKPAEAHAQFEAWEKSHPEDPIGGASQAVSYLFEECNRQGVLTSEFFLDDKRLLGKIGVEPGQKLRAAFFAAEQRAQDLARSQLETNPDDVDALFAMALSLGIQAGYTGLIDKHQVESLRMIREADKYAKRLLAAAPDAADAYLTLGATNYIIGSQPAHKRFFLAFAGIRGDKRLGMQQLEIAAARGHYLRPFAKIMLTVAALREKQLDVARTQLAELAAEFPANPLFATELAKLSSS